MSGGLSGRKSLALLVSGKTKLFGTRRVPIERGAVYLARVPGTARGGVGTADLEKYIVLLQDFSMMDVNATQFAAIICSTDQTGPQGPRAFEVRLDESDNFDRPTIVDGRWVYTFPRSRLDQAVYLFTLTPDRMEQVSLAIFIGLQLSM
jgi:predicted RNA-binding protein with TRAM domain